MYYHSTELKQMSYSNLKMFSADYSFTNHIFNIIGIFPTLYGNNIATSVRRKKHNTV